MLEKAPFTAFNFLRTTKGNGGLTQGPQDDVFVGLWVVAEHHLPVGCVLFGQEQLCVSILIVCQTQALEGLHPVVIIIGRHAACQWRNTLTYFLNSVLTINSVLF